MEQITAKVAIEKNGLSDVRIENPHGTYSFFCAIEPFTKDGKDYFNLFIRIVLDVDDFNGNVGDVSVIGTHLFAINTGCVPYWKDLLTYFDGAVAAILNVLIPAVSPHLDFYKIPFVPLNEEQSRSLLLQAIDKVY